MKHTQLNKGVSAQHNRALENSTHLHTQSWVYWNAQWGRGNLRARACNPGPSTEAAEPTASENPVAAGKVVHTLWPPDHSRHPWPQASGEQWQWGPRPCPSSTWGAHDPSSHPPSPTEDPVPQGIPDTRKEPTILVMTVALAEAWQQRRWWHKKQQRRHRATPITGWVEAEKC